MPAVHYEPASTNFLLIMAKKFQIRGSVGYPDRFQDAMDLLSRKDLSALVTHRFEIDQFSDALAVVGGDKNCGKVMLTIGDDRSASH